MMKRTGHAGFTLLEVLAAMVIMAGAVMAITQRQSQSMFYTRTLVTQAEALAAAETAMDEFLVHPEFEVSGDMIESETELDVPGVTDRGFRLVRTIGEVIPIEDQDSIYVDPDAEPYYELTEEELDMIDNDEPLFDPGTFVSVRFEVYRTQGRPVRLATLETWLPKPPLPDEEEDLGADSGGTTAVPGGMTGTRPSAPIPAGGTGGGRTPGGGRMPRGGGAGGGRPTGGGQPGGGR